MQKSIHELSFISLEITGKCNLDCKHCYMNAKHQSNTDLTTEDWKIFINHIYKQFGNKISIGITGGEPLIRSDLIEILKYMKSLGFNVSLSTNGILLNEYIIKFLKNNILGLSISLDGLENTHNYLRQSDVFNKTLENIKLCKKNNIKALCIKTAVYKKNLNKLKDLYEIIKNIEPDEWHLFAVEPIGRGEINKKEILSLMEYNILCDFVDKIRNNKLPRGKPTRY